MDDHAAPLAPALAAHAAGGGGPAPAAAGAAAAHIAASTGAPRTGPGAVGAGQGEASAAGTAACITTFTTARASKERRAAAIWPDPSACAETCSACAACRTGEQGALATGEKAPVSEQDQLGQEIARGARGDWLEGECVGSGMGLLSLPFWLMAELREKCRR